MSSLVDARVGFGSLLALLDVCATFVVEALAVCRRRGREIFALLLLLLAASRSGPGILLMADGLD